MKKRFLFLTVICNIFFINTIYSQTNSIEFGTSHSFDIATWNIEHFPKKEQQTIEYLKDIIVQSKIDLFALQEIDDKTKLESMVAQLNGYECVFGSGYYGGLAYIYKSNEIKINSIYKIYTEEEYWRAFPRSPLIIEITYLEDNYIIINNHFKCCGDGVLDLDNDQDEEKRRYDAVNLLKNYVDTHFSDQKVIVLGDLNDILTDNVDNNVFQAFIDDGQNYQFADMDIATGETSAWSFPNWPSHLDHILITDELFLNSANYSITTKTLSLEKYFNGGFNDYDYYVSDHLPVAMQVIDGQTVDIKNIVDIDKFRIYPNPAYDIINFDIKKLDNASIKIFNTNGIFIKEVNFDKDTDMINLDCSNFSDGIYYAVLYTDNIFYRCLKFVVN